MVGSLLFIFKLLIFADRFFVRSFCFFFTSFFPRSMNCQFEFGSIVYDCLHNRKNWFSFLWQTKLELSKNKSDQRQITHTNTIAQSKENFVDLKSFSSFIRLNFTQNRRIQSKSGNTNNTRESFRSHFVYLSTSISETGVLKTACKRSNESSKGDKRITFIYKLYLVPFFGCLFYRYSFVKRIKFHM